MQKPFSAYERGYRAAIAGQPRKVPSSVRRALPSLSSEWFRGHDAAMRDSEAERAQVLAEFEA